MSEAPKLEIWMFDEYARRAASNIEDEFVKPGVMQRRAAIQVHIRDAIDSAMKEFIRRVNEISSGEIK